MCVGVGVGVGGGAMFQSPEDESGTMALALRQDSF